MLLTAASLVLSVLIVGPAGSAFAAGKIADGKKKGFICHATGSKKNPYVLIKVPKNSAHFTKHEDDKKPIWVKGKPSCDFPKKGDHYKKY